MLTRWGRPGTIVCDRWRVGELQDALEAKKFPLTRIVVRGQGFKDGGEDVRLFRRAVVSEWLSPGRSLLMRSALAEARVTTDPAGNAKLAKSTEGGRRQNARDDAIAVAILAVGEGERRRAAPAKRPRIHVAG